MKQHIDSFLSNQQIEIELGARLKAKRLEVNLTQTEISESSGLARRTITSIEHGNGATLASVVAFLRALNSVHTLDGFLPDLGISPMAALMMQEEPVRHYASKPRKKATPPTTWKWGDEK